MHKKTMVYLSNEVILNNNKKWIAEMYYNMDELLNCYANKKAKQEIPFIVWFHLDDIGKSCPERRWFSDARGCEGGQN